MFFFLVLGLRWRGALTGVHTVVRGRAEWTRAGAGLLVTVGGPGRG